MTDPSFDDALVSFLLGAQAIVNDYFKTHLPNLKPALLSLERGKRYVRVVTTDDDGHGQRVYCFIDSTNGDILKAASWKAPAKTARGNIYKGLAGINQYGANYL